MTAPKAGTPFQDRVLVVAPHMDDETLGCGVMMAHHPRKDQVHVVFATDGSRSPRPALIGSRPIDLVAIRESEARAALAVLGVPETNLEFYQFPDGELARHLPSFAARLSETLDRLGPAQLFVPFRYDRHPDHLAVNRAATRNRAGAGSQVQVLEYFVYSRSRLLPAGDLRAYLSPADVIRLEPGVDASLKLRALECYRSQTTRFVDGQPRPILTRALLERVSAEPEVFLRHDAARPGPRVFERGRLWIPIAHRVEPVLKRWKDRVVGAGGW